MIMLSILQIENIATIEKATVDFSSGLNILTGETGAGKSILIDSINAVLGAKTSRDLIRTGADAAAVSAVFTCVSVAVNEKLEEMGLPTEEDGSLQLRRKLYKDGRNACFLNGTAVTVSMLRTVASELICIHGQRDSQALLQNERHYSFLDDYAAAAPQRAAYNDCFLKLRQLKKEYDALEMDEAMKARQLDLLGYQVGELSNAEIRIGEIEQLRHRKAVIQNAARVKNSISSAIRALVGAEDVPGADECLRDAVDEIIGISDVASGLSELVGQLESAKDVVEDAAGALEDALGQLEEGGEELERIEERLDLLSRLSKKYGGTEEQMLAFLAEAQAELDRIVFSDEKREALSIEIGEKETELRSLAGALTDVRVAAGARLSAAVQDALSFLDMPHVRFVVQIDACAYKENGADDVRFLLSANPGEAPKPLDRVASGGELSRVMLALKTVLRTDAGSTSMIFDEIDAGVSGRAAGKIAQKLASLARGGQVLCVTHSAQIAAFADVHKLIRKRVENGKTYTEIETLSPDARARVLAEITYGASASEMQIDSAREMMERAAAIKNESDNIATGE